MSKVSTSPGAPRGSYAGNVFTAAQLANETAPAAAAVAPVKNVVESFAEFAQTPIGQQIVGMAMQVAQTYIQAHQAKPEKDNTILFGD